MYTVYGKLFSRAIRVVWMLEELGVPYQLVPTSPHSPEAHKLNPSGKVPAMIDHEAKGEPVIVDSVAITQYLADKHNRFTCRAGTIERALQDSFTQFAIDEIEGPVWTFAKHSFVLPKELRHPDIRSALEYDFERAMKTLSVRMGSNMYLTGDDFTVADIVTFHSMQWARANKFEIAQESLRKYLERVEARDAWQRIAALRHAEK